MSRTTPSTPHDTSFGARLRAHRLSQGLSRKTVAIAVGINPNTLFNWEQGRTKPDLTRAGPLARALSIPVAALFTDQLVLEVVIAPETIEAIRKGGRAEATAAATRLATRLEPALYDLATRKPADARPGARPKPRLTRAERLATLKATHGKAAKRRSIQ